MQRRHLVYTNRNGGELIMIQTQLRHGAKGPKEGFGFHPIYVQLVIAEVEVLQSGLHVTEHEARHTLDLIAHQHQVDQGPGQERRHQVQVVV